MTRERFTETIGYGAAFEVLLYVHTGGHITLSLSLSLSGHICRICLRRPVSFSGWTPARTAVYLGLLMDRDPGPMLTREDVSRRAPEHSQRSPRAFSQFTTSREEDKRSKAKGGEKIDECSKMARRFILTRFSVAFRRAALTLAAPHAPNLKY